MPLPLPPAVRQTDGPHRRATERRRLLPPCTCGGGHDRRTTRAFAWPGQYPPRRCRCRESRLSTPPPASPRRPGRRSQQRLHLLPSPVGRRKNAAECRNPFFPERGAPGVVLLAENCALGQSKRFERIEQ